MKSIHAAPLKWIFNSLLMLFMLSGCSLFAVQSEQNTTPGLGLLAPELLGYELFVLQKIDAKFPSPKSTSTSTPTSTSMQPSEEFATRSFQVIVEADQEQIQMVALTEQGLKLFTLNYTGNNIAIERSRLVDESMEKYAVNILRDFQRAYWPISAWQASASTGASTNSESNAVQVKDVNDTMRVFTANTQTLLSINYSQANRIASNITIRNHEQGYQLAVQTLEFEATPYSK